MSMTVNPKQVKNLVTTFCELDEEYREKALRAVNKVFQIIFVQEGVNKEIFLLQKKINLQFVAKS